MTEEQQLSQTKQALPEGCPTPPCLELVMMPLLRLQQCQRLSPAHSAQHSTDHNQSTLFQAKPTCWTDAMFPELENEVWVLEEWRPSTCLAPQARLLRLPDSFRPDAVFEQSKKMSLAVPPEAFALRRRRPAKGSCHWQRAQHLAWQLLRVLLLGSQAALGLALSLLDAWAQPSVLVMWLPPLP